MWFIKDTFSLWSITNVLCVKMFCGWLRKEWLLSLVSYLFYEVSLMMSFVSCLMSPVSYLQSHVSCLTSPVSCRNIVYAWAVNLNFSVWQLSISVDPQEARHLSQKFGFSFQQTFNTKVKIQYILQRLTKLLYFLKQKLVKFKRKQKLLLVLTCCK